MLRGGGRLLEKGLVGCGCLLWLLVAFVQARPTAPEAILIGDTIAQSGLMSASIYMFAFEAI